MLKLLLVLILIGFLFVEIYRPRTMSTPGENDPFKSWSDIRVQVSENESDSDETLSELQTRLQKLEKKKRLSAEKAKKKELKARIAELEKKFAEKVPVVEAEDPKIEDLRQKLIFNKQSEPE